MTSLVPSPFHGQGSGGRYAMQSWGWSPGLLLDDLPGQARQVAGGMGSALPSYSLRLQKQAHRKVV